MQEMDDIYNEIVQKYFNSDQEVIISKIEFQPHLSEKTYLLKLGVVCDKITREASFLVKKIPEDAQGLNKTQFNKESFIYTNFNIDVLPKLYFSNNDIIILEDVGKNNFRPLNLTTAKEEHIHVALKTIAKLHAHSIALGDAKSCENSESLLLQASINAIDFVPESSKNLEKILNYIKNPIDKECKCKVWCHGSLIPENLLYLYEDGHPSRCKLVNFEFSYYAPPAYDVIFFLYQNTRECIDQYTQIYYKNLNRELRKLNLDIENILAYEEFERTCRWFMIPVKILTTIYTTSNGALELLKTDEILKVEMATILEGIQDTLVNPEIALEDCHRIMKRKFPLKQYKILDYELIPFAERSGFLAEHAILQINAHFQNEVKKLSFFVKTLSETGVQRDFVLSSGIFFKETLMFTKIIPTVKRHGVHLIDECIPQCYLARLNEALVFENLAEKGYVTLDHRSSLDYNTVAVVLKSLARFHASFLILEEKLSTGTQAYRLGEHYKKELVEPYYTGPTEADLKGFMPARKAVGTQIDLFLKNKDTDLDQFKIDAITAINDLYKYVIPSAKYRNTICHGDLWTNNAMLRFEKSEPVHCIFVDFQVYRYNPPAHDVMAMIYLTTSRAFRAKYMRKVMDLYYNELRLVFEQHNIGINEILTYGDFIESCDYLKKFAITQAVLYFQNIMLTSKDLKNLFDDNELCKKVLFKDKCDFLIETCKNDPVYREKLFESIADLRDICQLSDC